MNDLYCSIRLYREGSEYPIVDHYGDYAGAHIITATGISVDPADNVGFLNFIDPYNEVAAGPALDITGDLVDHNGLMQLQYNGGGSGVDFDPDNPDQVGQADIAMIVAESPVPEPITFSWMVIFGGSLLCRRSRRSI